MAKLRSMLACKPSIEEASRHKDPIKKSLYKHNILWQCFPNDARGSMSEQEEDEIQEHTALQLGLVIERDARGRIISSYRPAPFIIDQLLEHGVIDREQHWHAEQFVAMHQVFLRPVATFKTVSSYQSADEGRPPAKYPIADNDYLIVLRDMRHDWQRNIIRAAILTEFNLTLLEKLAFDADPDKQEKKRNHVSNAFWSMTYAINRLLERKQKAMEAEEERKKAERGECHADL